MNYSVENCSDEALRQMYTEDTVREIRISASLEEMIEELPFQDPSFVAQKICKTQIPSTYEGVFKMCCNIIEFTESFSGNHQIIANLFSCLIALQAPDNYLGEIKMIMARFAWDPNFISNYITARLTQLFFFSQFWKELGFTEEEIVNGIEFHYNECPLSDYSLTFFFIFFQDFLSGANPKLYSKIKQMHTQMVRQKKSFSDAFHNCVSFSEDVWNNLESSVRRNDFPSKTTKILWADDVEEFKALSSQKGFDVQQQIENLVFLPLCGAMRSSNLLEFAAFTGATKIFHYLLEMGCDINQPSANLYTIAQLAAIGGSISIVATLAKLGANFSGVAHVAVMARKRELFMFVQNMNPTDINTEIPHFGSIVTQACGGGNVLAMLFFLNSGADINARDMRGQIPLHFSVRNGKREISMLLLENPLCKSGIKDRSGNTPLHAAAEYGHQDIVLSLLKKGEIDLNEQNDLGYTPLIMSAYRGKLRVIKALCEIPGINANAQSIWGKTALILATQCGYPSVVSFLIKLPFVDLNLHDTNGKTALHIAAESKLKRIVELLLESDRIDVNAVDSGGWTPLHLAAENGNTSIVKMLANDVRTNVNSCDLDGMTPLHFAVRNGKMHSILVLMNHPAIDPNVRDTRTHSPFFYSKNRPEVVECLLSFPSVETPDDF